MYAVGHLHNPLWGKFGVEQKGYLDDADAYIDKWNNSQCEQQQLR